MTKKIIPATYSRLDINQRPKQRYPRAILGVPLSLQHLASGGIRKSQGISLDLSEGGVGGLIPDELEAGELIAVEVALPGPMLKAVAIVRHAAHSRTGFEFVGLTPEERQRIASIIANPSPQFFRDPHSTALN